MWRSMWAAWIRNEQQQKNLLDTTMEHEGTKNIIDLCIKYNVPNLIYTSSSLVTLWVWKLLGVGVVSYVNHKVLVARFNDVSRPVLWCKGLFINNVDDGAGRGRRLCHCFQLSSKLIGGGRIPNSILFPRCLWTAPDYNNKCMLLLLMYKLFKDVTPPGFMSSTWRMINLRLP